MASSPFQPAKHIQNVLMKRVDGEFRKEYLEDAIGFDV